jgi:hypothetical protein
MIEVKYKSRLGNNLFQYCLGRILAEKKCFFLKADPIDGFENTKEIINGKDYTKNGFIELNDWNSNLGKILQNPPNKKIILNGWFQKYCFYKDYKKEIKNWLKIDFDNLPKVKDNDVVVYIRRGDYIELGYALPIEFYENCLLKLNYSKIYVCTDFPNDWFVKKFVKKYDATVFHNSALEDFCFIKSFNNIVMSASTFCWWAAYLSDAKKIFFPIPEKGFWSNKYTATDLRVNEKRYVYKKVSKMYSKSILDYPCIIKRRQKVILNFIKKKLNFLFSNR